LSNTAKKISFLADDAAIPNYYQASRKGVHCLRLLIVTKICPEKSSQKNSANKVAFICTENAVI